MTIYSNDFTPNDFYVYAYLRSKDSATAKKGTPYYIGKGKDGRAFKETRKFKPKDKRYIVIIEQGLTELGAFALERRMIRWYGRKNIGTGILQNKTDGGEGVTGMVVSSSVRDQISEKLKGKKRPNYVKDKISKSNKGKKHSVDAIERMKKTKKLNPHSPSSSTRTSIRNSLLAQPKYCCLGCARILSSSRINLHHCRVGQLLY
jgi:hypothetical protein